MHALIMLIIGPNDAKTEFYLISMAVDGTKWKTLFNRDIFFHDFN